MSTQDASRIELRNLASGLWIWRARHPAWVPGEGWDPLVTSTCVESDGQVLLLDPLLPSGDVAALCARAGGVRARAGA